MYTYMSYVYNMYFRIGECRYVCDRNVCIYIYIYTHTYRMAYAYRMHIRIYMNIYIYIYIYTYTHTRKPFHSSPVHSVPARVRKYVVVRTLVNIFNRRQHPKIPHIHAISFKIQLDSNRAGSYFTRVDFQKVHAQ